MDFIEQLLVADDPEDLMVEGKHAKSWNDLVTIMTQEWFSRRWVIQELALARDATVHCGTKVVYWEDFRHAISLLRLHVDSIRDLFKNSPEFEHNFWAIGDIELFGASVLVDVIPNIFRKHTSKTPRDPALGLETLVSTYAIFDSADPRDTIMAMRNIAKETIPNSRHKTTVEPPRLEYRKDLFEVYSDFIYWVVTTSESLDILCRHWARPERGTDDPKPPQYPALVTLPSWILETPKRPKYQIKQQNHSRFSGDSLVGLPGFASYNASNGKKPEVKLARLGQCNYEPVGDEATMGTTDVEKVKSLGNKPGGNMTPIIMDNGASKGQKRSLDLTADNSQGNTTNKRLKNWQHPKSVELPSHLYVKVQSSQANFSAVTPLKSPTVGQGSKSPEILKTVDKSLYVKGLRIGAITWRSDSIPDGVIPRIGLEKCDWDLDKYLKEDAEYRSFEIDKVLRTLVADRGADGRNPPTWYRRACENCLVNHTPNGHMNTRDLLRTKQPEYVKRFLKRVQAVTWDRVFLETNSKLNSPDASPIDNVGPVAGGSTSLSERLVGLGPSGTKNGDILTILYGCSVPVVLREIIEKGERFFIFIGEAFVYGKMDGEAINMLSPEELEKQTEEFRLI